MMNQYLNLVQPVLFIDILEKKFYQTFVKVYME